MAELHTTSGGQVSCLMCTITCILPPSPPRPFIDPFIPRWREWTCIAIQACITADVGHDVAISLSRDWDSASENGHNLAVFSTATQWLSQIRNSYRAGTSTLLSDHVARRTNCSEAFRPSLVTKQFCDWQRPLRSKTHFNLLPLLCDHSTMSLFGSAP